MKITEIEIKKFRNLSGVNILFGERMNAIAGQNGTSKTSILGLIGHIFTFTSNPKTLAGKKYATEFSGIFKFAYPDYDKAGDHNWIVKFENGKEIPAFSTARRDKRTTGTKQSLRVRVGERKNAEAK